MIQSKYLTRFQQLAASGLSVPLKGAYILVERIPKEERKTKGGIVLASEQISMRQVNGMDPSRSLLFVRALYLGAGYYDEENEATTIPLEVQPGNILAVPFTSIKWFSEFGDMVDYTQDSIGLITEDSVQWALKDDAEYAAMFGVLNRNEE